MLSGISKIRISCEDIYEFYKNYLLCIRLLNPISKLSKKHIDIIAFLLAKRYELSKSVTDESLISQLLFSVEIRNMIIEKFDISVSNYYNIISYFSKVGIIRDKDFIKKLLPILDGNRFVLQIGFEFNI